MQTVRATIALLLLLVSLSERITQAAVTVDATDFGITQGGDATFALLNAVEACRERGADRLVIPKGVYHFFPDRAFQKYCAISNNDSGLKHIALPLIGFEGFTVDAQGSEFIMHGHMVPVVVEDSRNIIIENLTIDWNQPFNFQGTVVGVDEAGGSFDVEPHSECNISIQGRALVNTEVATPPQGGKLDTWWTPWEQDLRWSLFFDGTTRAPVTRLSNAGALPWGMLEGPVHYVEKVGDNRYRLHHACREYPEPGMILVAKGMNQPNRLSPGIHLYKAFNVTLRDVTVHHAGGMGLIGERSGDITMERFAVRLRPGSGRVVSTTADATHFVGCRGLIRFEGCFFENMLDDATNVHGVYTRIEKKIGPRTLLVKLMHFQQFGFTFAGPGDRIRFSDRKSLTPYGEAEVVAVDPVNEQYMEITVDQDLEGLLRDDSLLDNLSWQADVLMRNCTVSRNRARSILLSTTGDIVIENNTFDRSSMMNILMSGDADVWHESCGVRSVRIAGNRFIDLNDDVEMIRIGPHPAEGVVPAEAYHRNIVIENNRFETLSPKLVTAAHASGIVFRNNTIVAAESFADGNGGDSAFVLENCQDVTIEGNANGLAEPLRVTADGLSRRLKLDGAERRQ